MSEKDAVPGIDTVFPYDKDKPIKGSETLGDRFRKCFRPYNKLPADVEHVCQNCEHNELCLMLARQVIERSHVLPPVCKDPAEIAEAHKALATSRKICVPQRSFTEEFYILCEKDEYGRWDRVTIDEETLEQLWKFIGKEDLFFEANGREYAIFKRTVTIKDEMTVPLVRYHDLVHFYDTQVGAGTPKTN